MNLKDKFLDYFKAAKYFEFYRYTNFYDNSEQIAQDLADIAREYHLIYMEELLKENIELKQIIKHDDGIHMQNEDLIRENEDLKEQLKQLKKSLDERGIIY